MKKLVFKISFLFILLICLSFHGSTSLKQKNQISPNQRQLKHEELSQNLNFNPDFGKIPLYFIPNQGQIDDKALFYAKASRYTLWLTKKGLVFDSTRRIEKESAESERLNPRDKNNPEDFTYDREVSRLVFLNANRNPEVIPVDITEHKVNYFIGKNKSKWRSKIQTSRAVLYKELYPCIDLKVYGIERQIEYDFAVKPGGEVSDIGFEYIDVEKTRIDKIGNLVIETKFGDFEHTKPICYQVIEGERVEIQAEFLKIGDNNYGFKVKGYNRKYELIIDPVVLVYSTYLGGSREDLSFGIAVDSEGAAYVTGDTSSTDFPTQNPIQGTRSGQGDAFITKINSSGSALIYSTYLGGSGGDHGSRIAVDSEGMAYVTGQTDSIDFPTQNPIQGSFGEGEDAFITKVNSSGNAFIYSTYLGGSGTDYSNDGNGIAVDSEGAAYVTGDTNSTDFPTQNPIQGTKSGQADAFIAKVNSLGNALIYSTYLGGSAEDRGFGIAVDSEGAAYVTGDTNSTDFPTQNPIQGSLRGGIDIFITKVNSSGSALIYSTYLGGSNWDLGFGIGVDSEGAACVTGVTWSGNFPTQNPIQGSFGGGEDAFITKVNSSGSAFIYSTYLGGSGEDRDKDIAVDSEGAAYVTGRTTSIDFPTKSPFQGINAGGHDIFIAKIGSSERIRIVSWNILDYPDLNEEPREEYFRSILEILNPDILVVQEMTSTAGVNQFLKEILNPKKPKLYKAAAFFDGPDTDNALFYKKAMFKLISHQQIPTPYRDITEYKMKIKKGAGKGTKFRVYSVHFTEGAGAKKKRENEAITLRTYLDGLLPDELFLVCGSFNMMSSKEKAFKILTGNQANNIGRLMDPIHKKGKWHDKTKHRPIHTESTRKSKFGGGKGGGLDDRFDMILISYGLEEIEKLIYSDGSYYVFGNDGKHLNKAVNKPKNKIVSPDIADALYMASDHLPVIIDLVPQDESE